MVQRIGWHGLRFQTDILLHGRDAEIRATMTPTRRRVEATSPPAWVKPQLAALVKKAPDGPDWLHEIRSYEFYRGAFSAVILPCTGKPGEPLRMRPTLISI